MDMNLSECGPDETRTWRTAATKTIEEAIQTGESLRDGTATSTEERHARAVHLENLIFVRAHPFGRSTFSRLIATAGLWLRENRDVGRYSDGMSDEERNAKLVDDLVMDWQTGGSKGSAPAPPPPPPSISAERTRIIRRYPGQQRPVASSSAQTFLSSTVNRTGPGFNVARRQRSLPYRPPPFPVVVKTEPPSPSRGNVARRARPQQGQNFIPIISRVPTSTSSSGQGNATPAQPANVPSTSTMSQNVVVRMARQGQNCIPVIYRVPTLSSGQGNAPLVQQPNIPNTMSQNVPAATSGQRNISFLIIQRTVEQNIPPPSSPPAVRHTREANSPPPKLADSPPPNRRQSRESNSPPPRDRHTREANSPPPKLVNSPPPNRRQSREANSPPLPVRHTREANSPPPKLRKSARARTPSPTPTILTPRSAPREGVKVPTLSPPNINGRPLLSSGESSTSTPTNLMIRRIPDQTLTPNCNNNLSPGDESNIEAAITNRINIAVEKWGSLNHPANSLLRAQLATFFTERQLAQALISRMTTQGAALSNLPVTPSIAPASPPARETIDPPRGPGGVSGPIPPQQTTTSMNQPPLPPLRISTTFPHRIITTETETVKKLDLRERSKSPIIGQIFRISTRAPPTPSPPQRTQGGQSESISQLESPPASSPPPRAQNSDPTISTNLRASTPPGPMEERRPSSPECIIIEDNTPVPPKPKIVVITLDDEDESAPSKIPTRTLPVLPRPPVKVEPTGNRRDDKRPPPPRPSGNDASFSRDEGPNFSPNTVTVSSVSADSATETMSPFDFTSSASPSTPGQGQTVTLPQDKSLINQDQAVVTSSTVQDMEMDPGQGQGQSSTNPEITPEPDMEIDRGQGQFQNLTNPNVTPEPDESNNDVEMDVTLPIGNDSQPTNHQEQLPVPPPPRIRPRGLNQILPRLPPALRNLSRPGHDPDDDPDDSSSSSDEEEEGETNYSSEDDDEQEARGPPLNWKSLPLSEMIKHSLDEEGESSRKDVTFLVGSEGTPITAHTLFLALISAPFDDLFTAAIAAIQPPPLTRRGLQLTIPLSDVDPEAFRIILRYIYHREWKEDRTWSVETRIKLLKAAVKFDLIEVSTRTRASLRSELNNFTATIILDHAVSLGDHRLRQSALRHIELNATTILKSDSIRTLSLDGLCVIFASDELITEENVVYEAAKCWARHQLTPVGPPVKNESGDGDEIRSTLGRALHLVRFPIMKSDYFLNEVFIDGILPSEDVTKLVRYLCLSAEIPLDQRPDPAPYSTNLRVGSSRDLSAVMGNDDSGGGGGGDGDGGGDGRGSRSSLTGSSSVSSETLRPPVERETNNQNQDESVRPPPPEQQSKRIKLETPPKPKPASARPTIAGHVTPAALDVFLVDDEQPGPSRPTLSPVVPNPLSSPDLIVIYPLTSTPIPKSKSKPTANLLTTADEDAYISSQIVSTCNSYPEKKTLRALYSTISSDAPSTIESITADGIVLDTKSLFLLDLPRLQRAQIDFLYGPGKTVTNFKEYLTRLQIQSSILFFKKGHDSLTALWDSGVNVNLGINGVNVLEVEHDTGSLKISRINSAADQILQGLKMGEEVDSLLLLKHLFLDEVNIASLSRIPILSLKSITLRKVKGIKDRVNFIRSCNQILTSFSCDDMGLETLNFGEDVGLMSEGTPTLAQIALGKARLDCSQMGDKVITSSPVEELYLDKCTWTLDFVTAIPYIFPNLRKVKICSNVTFKLVQAFVDIATLEWLGVWELEFPLKKKGASGGGGGGGCGTGVGSSKRKRGGDEVGRGSGGGDGMATVDLVDPEVTKMISLLSEAGLGNASWLTRGQKTFILEKVVLHGPQEAGSSSIITKAWKGTKLIGSQKYKEFTKLDFDQFGWNVFYSNDFDLFHKING